MKTTIKLSFETKEKLNKLKIHRETYEDVVLFLLKNNSSPLNTSRGLGFPHSYLVGRGISYG